GARQQDGPRRGVRQTREWSTGLLDRGLTFALLLFGPPGVCCSGPICVLAQPLFRDGCVAKKIIGGMDWSSSSFPEGSGSLQSERVVDELHLPNYIPFQQPPYLTLPNHVQNFVALNRSPRPVKGSESLTRIHSPFDGSMVLFHHVVQVGAGSTATSAT